MNIYESMEDYLEKILMLKQKQEVVRAVDLVRFMNYSKASVSIALKKLIAKGLIIHNEKNGDLSLTEEGMKIASNIYARHQLLGDFFQKIGVGKEQAFIDACKVEHEISEETFEKLKDFVATLK